MRRRNLDAEMAFDVKFQRVMWKTTSEQAVWYASVVWCFGRKRSLMMVMMIMEMIAFEK